MIAAASGENLSLDMIKDMFTEGIVTKAQYERVLCAYQNNQEETQSDQRTRALEFLRAQPTIQ